MHKEEFINDTEKHENFAGILSFCRLANFYFVGMIVLCFKIAENFAGNQFCNFFRQQNVNKQESTTLFFLTTRLVTVSSCFNHVKKSEDLPAQGLSLKFGVHFL